MPPKTITGSYLKLKYYAQDNKNRIVEFGLLIKVSMFLWYNRYVIFSMNTSKNYNSNLHNPNNIYIRIYWPGGG